MNATRCQEFTGSKKPVIAILFALFFSTLFSVLSPVQAAEQKPKVVVIPLGADSPSTSWKGPWETGITYKHLDIVEFNGSSYIAVSNHTSALTNFPPDPVWDLLAASGANGVDGIDGTPGSQGPAGATGPQGPAGQDGADGAIGPQGTAAVTPPLCVGAYKTLQFDGSNFICVENIFSTGLSGGMANGFERVDSWGDAWDGSPRPPKNFAQASAICQSSGGRLPTATELFRVNALSGTGEVGDSGSTDYLWTQILYNAVSYYRVRLSDGATTYQNEGSLSPFSCIWPSNSDTTFSSNNCYGPPGTECTTSSSENGHYNIDSYDRVPLNPVGATRECAFYNAHLASANALTESVQSGLANGTDNWLWTSDHTGFKYLSIMKWAGVDTAYSDEYPGDTNWSEVSLNYSRPFRCTGLSTPVSVYSGAVADAWSDANLKSTSTQNDNAAKTYIESIDSCRALGGHLPYQRDLNELISAGLPNGSNAWLWTADTMSDDSSIGNTGGVRWSNIDTNYLDTYPSYTTWLSRSSAGNKYRCVFYPVDTSYAGPQTSNCSGACFSDTENGSGVATTMWIDSTDRTSNTYGNAVRTCQTEGGHLPTHRDMTEMIRAGAPGGTDNWLWTSDHGSYRVVEGVKWAGIDTSWNDDSTVLLRDDMSTYPYRCVWGNELNW